MYTSNLHSTEDASIVRLIRRLCRHALSKQDDKSNRPSSARDLKKLQNETLETLLLFRPEPLSSTEMAMPAVDQLRTVAYNARVSGDTLKANRMEECVKRLGVLQPELVDPILEFLMTYRRIEAENVMEDGEVGSEIEDEEDEEWYCARWMDNAPVSLGDEANNWLEELDAFEAEDRTQPVLLEETDRTIRWTVPPKVELNVNSWETVGQWKGQQTSRARCVTEAGNDYVTSFVQIQQRSLALMFGLDACPTNKQYSVSDLFSLLGGFPVGESNSSDYIGFTPSCVNNMLEGFTACAEDIQLIEERCSSARTDEGIISEAFWCGVQDYLNAYRNDILEMQEKLANERSSLIKFVHLTRPLRDTIHVLRTITTDVGSGMPLLATLYLSAIVYQGSVHKPLILYLFQCASRPFFEYLERWLFDGILEDPFSEFPIDFDRRWIEQRRCDCLWAEAISLRPFKTNHPFLVDATETIMECGKSAILLRQLRAQSFRSLLPHFRLSLCLTDKELDEVNRIAQHYREGEHLKENDDLLGSGDVKITDVTDNVESGKVNASGDAGLNKTEMSSPVSDLIYFDFSRELEQSQRSRLDLLPVCTTIKPLDRIIHESLEPLVAAHAVVVSSECVRIFREDYNLLKHISAIYSIVCVTDGSFTCRLTELLLDTCLDKSELVPMQNIALTLGSIFADAVEVLQTPIESEIVENMSLMLFPRSKLRSPADYIESLQIKYAVEWPLDLVLSEKIMERYNRVFSHMLITSCARKVLSELWRQMMHEDSKHRRCFIEAEARQVASMRLRMCTSLNELYIHAIHSVLVPAQRKLVDALERATSPGEMRRIHELSTKALCAQYFTQTRGRIMRDLFRLTLEFRSILRSASIDGALNSEMYERVQTIYSTFDSNHRVFGVL